MSALAAEPAIEYLPNNLIKVLQFTVSFEIPRSVLEVSIENPLR